MFISSKRFEKVENSISNIEGFMKKSTPMIEDYYFKQEAKKRIISKITLFTKILGSVGLTLGVYFSLMKFIV